MSDLTMMAEVFTVFSQIIESLPSVIIWLGTISFSSVILISIMLHIRR